MAMSLAACARPPSTTVREGADPVQVDKDVVFRTSYYFRVFDYCVAKNQRDDHPEKNIIPLTDSLYRFKMTGKANTLLSDVKFESGTLSQSEIEPFSQRVEYDPDSRRHRIISKQEVERDARRARARADLRELIATRDALVQQLGAGAQAAEAAANQQMLTNVNTAIAETLRYVYQLQRGEGPQSANTTGEGPGTGLRSISTSDPSFDGVVEAVGKAIIDLYPQANRSAVYEELRYNSPTSNIIYEDYRKQRSSARRYEVIDISADLLGKVEASLKARLSAADLGTRAGTDPARGFSVVSRVREGESIQCPDDAPTQRGFQVLGPEGWRTFDQNERLLMAMSSSAQPLISTLKELSSRVLEARASPEAELLPLALERARVSDTERQLDRDRDAVRQTPEALSRTVCQSLLTEAQSAEVCQ